MGNLSSAIILTGYKKEANKAQSYPNNQRRQYVWFLPYFDSFIKHQGFLLDVSSFPVIYM